MGDEDAINNYNKDFRHRMGYPEGLPGSKFNTRTQKPTNTHVSVHIQMAALSKSVFTKALVGATQFSAQKLNAKQPIIAYLIVAAQC
jgi:hypothetical protein